MSGNGGIIIRHSVQQALTNPVISGVLPQHLRDAIAPFIETEVGLWTAPQHRIAMLAYYVAGCHFA